MTVRECVENGVGVWCSPIFENIHNTNFSQYQHHCQYSWRGLLSSSLRGSIGDKGKVLQVSRKSSSIGRQGPFQLLQPMLMVIYLEGNMLK